MRHSERERGTFPSERGRDGSRGYRGRSIPDCDRCSPRVELVKRKGGWERTSFSLWKQARRFSFAIKLSRERKSRRSQRAFPRCSQRADGDPLCHTMWAALRDGLLNRPKRCALSCGWGGVKGDGVSGFPVHRGLVPSVPRVCILSRLAGGANVSPPAFAWGEVRCLASDVTAMIRPCSENHMDRRRPRVNLNIESGNSFFFFFSSRRFEARTPHAQIACRWRATEMRGDWRSSVARYMSVGYEIKKDIIWAGERVKIPRRTIFHTHDRAWRPFLYLEGVWR